jgi:predicted metal-dependent hydrolase
MKKLVVDDLTLAVRHSDRRRTMQITVDRDGSLIVMAPPGTARSQLAGFVREKQFWIYRKLAEKSATQHVVPRKEFVNGEGFLYLGRSYRLKIVPGQDEPLKLIAGRFCLRRDALPDARDTFIHWYTDRGRTWLTDKVWALAPRLDVEPGEIRVLDLGYRWGSCGKGNRMYFHWKTILLPRPVAEYVVVHELIHLHDRHHTPNFWRRLERAMPDFERRKADLARMGPVVDRV